jgi:hypothetical protein
MIIQSYRFCHSRESGNLLTKFLKEIPAFAGMTMLIGMVTVSPALAQQATQLDGMQQMQKLMQGKDAGANIGKALVAGTILGCTNKKVGKEATNAFYADLQATGKQAEAYCKQNNAPAARMLVVNKVEQKRNDPVAKAAVDCYYQNREAIAGLAGQRMAADLAQYVAWFQTPGAAAAQIKDKDICR